MADLPKGAFRAVTGLSVYKNIILMFFAFCSLFVAVAIGTGQYLLVALVFSALYLVMWLMAPRQRKFPNAADVCDTKDVEGKVVMITGPTSAIGVETARVFVRYGCKMLILAGRSIKKLDPLKEDLQRDVPKDKDTKIVTVVLDLDDLESAKICAQTVQEKFTEKLDILILNAGLMALPTRKTTKQGVETQMGVCHVAHASLVKQLLPALRKGSADEPAARVVSVASAAWALGYYTFVQSPSLEDDKAGYLPDRNYGNAKTACMLWMNDLNRREEAFFAKNQEKTRRVCAVSVHPGGIFSGLQENIPFYPTYLAWMIVAPFQFKSKKQGAATSVFCATKADVENADGGKYFDNCAPDNKAFARLENMAAEDLKEPGITVQQLASRVWENTEKLCKNIGFPLPDEAMDSGSTSATHAGQGKAAQVDEVPIINLATLEGAQDSDHPEVCKLRRACCETGFFLVTGHSIPTSVVDGVFDISERFFSLSQETKLAHIGSELTGWRGYGPYGNGQNCNLESKLPERKETFYCGEPPAADNTVPEPMEKFYDTLRPLHTELLRISRLLLRGLSLALRLKAYYFEELAFKRPVAKFLLTNYPSPDKDEESCGSHTDCGFLTLVCQDATDASGLQVQLQDGSWITVKSNRYMPVANLGDLAQRWTNDVYRSSWHRVLNLSPTPRRSVVFFNNLDEDAEVDCLPTCVSAERPAKYGRTTCGEYVAAKLNQMRTHGGLL